MNHDQKMIKLLFQNLNQIKRNQDQRLFCVSFFGGR